MFYISTDIPSTKRKGADYMSIGSTIGGFTTKEVTAILTYLENSYKPYSKASNFMKRFEREQISNPKGNDYYISNDPEIFFEELKKIPRFNKKLERQKIHDFETLKHTAINYCEDYDIPID